MNSPTQDAARPLRRQIYWLLIAVAAAAAAGRVLSAERLYEPSRAVPPGGRNDGRYQVWPEKQPRPMPTFGSNDRSRWDTVRALVDEGTFVIGRRDPSRVTKENPYGDYGIVFEDGWTSVDKVLNPATLEYYSSKPPLLSVLTAGEYWLLKHALGWSINERPNEVVRVGLLTFNVLPLIFYLWMLSRLAERYGATDWGRLFVLAAAAFGTLLTPFLITLNNHVPAAFAALAALYAALPIAFPEGATEGRSPGGAARLFAAGVAAGLLVNFELPAAAFVAALGLLLLIRAPLRTILCFLPPVLLLIAAYFFLNHLATGQWLPVYEKIDTPWYQYPGSIWATIHPGSGRGIEFAKYTESRWMYAFHLLFGHHGWFSLTPVNLLGAAGMVLAFVHLGGRMRRPAAGRAADGRLGRDHRGVGRRVAGRVSLLRLRGFDGQLRRLDQRAALAHVADAAVAVRRPARRRLARPAALGAGRVSGAIGAGGAVGQLYRLEPVATPVDLQLDGSTRLAAVLSRTFTALFRGGCHCG